MIRDPSDGTVYDPPQAEPKPKPVITATDSGLPTGSTKEKNIARLEASRNWLKDYFAKRGQSHD